jgi:hypothetical protein
MTVIVDRDRAPCGSHLSRAGRICCGSRASQWAYGKLAYVRRSDKQRIAQHFAVYGPSLAELERGATDLPTHRPIEPRHRRARAGAHAVESYPLLDTVGEFRRSRCVSFRISSYAKMPPRRSTPRREPSLFLLQGKGVNIGASTSRSTSGASVGPARREKAQVLKSLRCQSSASVCSNLPRPRDSESAGRSVQRASAYNICAGAGVVRGASSPNARSPCNR